MSNRHLFGDISFAVLIALSVVAFARPTPHHHQTVLSAAAAKTASADRVPGNGRISLL